jgi:hypothetical protein
LLLLLHEKLGIGVLVLLMFDCLPFVLGESFDAAPLIAVVADPYADNFLVRGIEHTGFLTLDLDS